MNAEARTRGALSSERQQVERLVPSEPDESTSRADSGVAIGRRLVWLKRTADSLRWTARSSARLPARVARPLIRRARPTSGPARKHAKPDAKAAWPAIVGARS